MILSLSECCATGCFKCFNSIFKECNYYKQSYNLEYKGKNNLEVIIYSTNRWMLLPVILVTTVLPCNIFIEISLNLRAWIQICALLIYLSTQCKIEIYVVCYKLHPPLEGKNPRQPLANIYLSNLLCYIMSICLTSQDTTQTLNKQVLIFLMLFFL